MNDERCEECQARIEQLQAAYQVRDELIKEREDLKIQLELHQLLWHKAQDALIPLTVLMQELLKQQGYVRS